MNPEVQALIQRALSNDIPIDAFMARMSQLGITPSEAQTILSNAAGGSPQGIDLSLSTEQQPIDQSAYNQMPQQPATVPTDGYSPQKGIMEKIRRATEISPERLKGLPSVADQPQTFGGIPAAAIGVPNELQSRPSGAQAGNMVAASMPQAQAPSPTTVPDMQDGREPVPPGQASTVQRAVQLAKTRSAAPEAQAASAQTSAAPPSDFLHTLIRGRFGDAAKGNPMDDRLTPAQEARASGGSVEAKPGKDAALHKALEIIHHLITRG